VEIIDGLMPGDEVVTRGSYSLGFAGSSGGPSLKEAMDAAHGHEHNEDGSEKTADNHAEDDHDHHDHAHDSQGTSPREMLIIASTILLALFLVLNALRRRSAESSTSELS
jgi:cobalt-zinc-cadmium efflux system membrane fusion protein